jgi:beta-glucosidase
MAEPGGTKDKFLWGVATSAYQAEGGHNVPGGPHNNWAAAEQKKSVMETGRASDFWNRYESDFELCRAMGLNAFRLGICWSRVQPTHQTTQATAPDFDEAAIEKYAQILAACRRAGQEPVVTLHHFTHPAWLGTDPWIDGSGIDPFVDFVSHTVRAVNRLLVDKHGVAPVRWFITINEPNMLALNSYLGRQFPAKHLPGLHAVHLCLQSLLVAHIRAYAAIHRIYQEEGWPAPMVSMNNYCSDLYWSDKFLIDLLTSREKGIGEAELGDYIMASSNAFQLEFDNAGLPLRRDLPYWIGDKVKRISLWLGCRMFSVEKYRPVLEALAACGHERVLDFIGLDYYDPFTAHIFRLPVFTDHEFRSLSFREWLMHSVTSKWWDWRVLPNGLEFFVRVWSRDYGHRPILIAENGMALRRRPDNTHSDRRDRMTRSEFLKRHVAEVELLVEAGWPVVGYLHWSLFDNYEWGSYTPRFGLYSIDYTHGEDRLAEDHFGDRPSETYTRLVATAKKRQQDRGIS